jgi:hypothetical protein
MRKYSIAPGKLLYLLAILLWAHGAWGVEVPPELRAAWQLQDGDEIVLVEEGRVVVWEQDHLRVLALLGYGEGQLMVRRAGLAERWRTEVTAGKLVIA